MKMPTIQVTTPMRMVFEDKRIIGAHLRELVEDDGTASVGEDEVQRIRFRVSQTYKATRRLASRPVRRGTRPTRRHARQDLQRPRRQHPQQRHRDFELGVTQVFFLAIIPVGTRFSVSTFMPQKISTPPPLPRTHGPDHPRGHRLPAAQGSVFKRSQLNLAKPANHSLREGSVPHLLEVEEDDSLVAVINDDGTMSLLLPRD
jgi:hypothetical protein